MRSIDPRKSERTNMVRTIHSNAHSDSNAWKNQLCINSGAILAKRLPRRLARSDGPLFFTGRRATFQPTNLRTYTKLLSVSTEGLFRLALLAGLLSRWRKKVMLLRQADQ